MTDKIKFGLIFGGIVVIFIIQLVVGHPAEVEANSTTDAHALRLRVIANSDDERDQLIKRLAVFAATEFMNSETFGYTESFLTDNLEGVHLHVAAVLEEAGVFGDIEVSFGKHYFPTSESYYPSLVIRLGEAAGQNWWCFINPGVCIVPTDEEESVALVQVETQTELRESMTRRAMNFVGGLFGAGESELISEDGIDWFLFDDER